MNVKRKNESGEERRKRLAAELRANLARRKAQARGRRASEDAESKENVAPAAKKSEHHPQKES